MHLSHFKPQFDKLVIFVPLKNHTPWFVRGLWEGCSECVHYGTVLQKVWVRGFSVAAGWWPTAIGAGLACSLFLVSSSSM